MSKKALVVEDDGNIAELLRLYLEIPFVILK